MFNWAGLGEKNIMNEFMKKTSRKADKIMLATDHFYNDVPVQNYGAPIPIAKYRRKFITGDDKILRQD